MSPTSTARVYTADLERMRVIAAVQGMTPQEVIHAALAEFNHALEPLADPSMRAQMRVGPLEISGAANVPHATTYRPSDFNLIAGASYRMVLDVGDWDASRTINTPGQSGNPLSPHYRDLAPLWATADSSVIHRPCDPAGSAWPSPARRSPPASPCRQCRRSCRGP